jgi:hypothetical protein
LTDVLLFWPIECAITVWKYSIERQPLGVARR